jgi:hypothetical protein
MVQADDGLFKVRLVPERGRPYQFVSSAGQHDVAETQTEWNEAVEARLSPYGSELASRGGPIQKGNQLGFFGCGQRCQGQAGGKRGTVAAKAQGAGAEAGHGRERRERGAALPNQHAGGLLVVIDDGYKIGRNGVLLVDATKFGEASGDKPAALVLGIDTKLAEITEASGVAIQKNVAGRATGEGDDSIIRASKQRPGICARERAPGKEVRLTLKGELDRAGHGVSAEKRAKSEIVGRSGFFDDGWSHRVPVRMGSWTGSGA